MGSTRRGISRVQAQGNLAINADRLIRLRASGQVPTGRLFISFAGYLPVENFLLIPDPGRKYDWRCIKELPVVVCIDDGAGSPSDLWPIAMEAKLQDAHVWHLTRKAGAFLTPDIVEHKGIPQYMSPHINLLPWLEISNRAFERDLLALDCY